MILKSSIPWKSQGSTNYCSISVTPPSATNSSPSSISIDFYSPLIRRRTSDKPRRDIYTMILVLKNAVNTSRDEKVNFHKLNWKKKTYQKSVNFFKFIRYNSKRNLRFWDEQFIQTSLSWSQLWLTNPQSWHCTILLSFPWHTTFKKCIGPVPSPKGWPCTVTASALIKKKVNIIHNSSSKALVAYTRHFPT